MTSKLYVGKFDESVYRSGNIRGNKIYKAEKPSDTPAEGKATLGCDYCKWTYACAKVSGDAFPEDNDVDEIDASVVDMFDPLVREHESLKELAKDYELQYKAKAVEIKALLSKQNNRRINSPDKWNMAYSWNAGQNRIDQNAMDADGIYLDKYRKECKGFEKLIITQKEYYDE